MTGRLQQWSDNLFGTRYHTEGASLQLPRKVPLRIEPKSYFGEAANSLQSVFACPWVFSWEPS